MRSVAIHSDLWVRFAYKVGPKSREGLAMVGGGTCNGMGVRGGVGVRVALCWARVRARREGGKD